MRFLTIFCQIRSLNYGKGILLEGVTLPHRLTTEPKKKTKRRLCLMRKHLLYINARRDVKQNVDS